MRNLSRYVGKGLREIFWIAIAGAVIFGGIAGYGYLGKNREVAEPAEIERPVTLVETAELTLIAAPLPVRGEGFLQPFRSADLAGQVGGQIVELHPAMINRSAFTQGDVLARLDDSTERAALTQTQANIDGTVARLELNKSLLERTETLRRSGAVSQATLDEVMAAQLELDATLTSLNAVQEASEINLGRRSILAPFDGAVLTKQVEVGSVIGAGQMIAEIFTRDRMEIDVPVRETDAALIPGLFDDASTAAVVSVRFAGQDFEWDAYVTRVSPTLDANTRTLTVTVELDDSTAARATGTNPVASGAPPALINSFAKVVLEGPRPDATYPIRSTALRDGNAVWLYEPTSDGGALKIIPAGLVHVDGEISYVRLGPLPDGARLILTALSTPQDGMQLRDVQDRARSMADASGETEPAQ